MPDRNAVRVGQHREDRVAVAFGDAHAFGHQRTHAINRHDPVEVHDVVHVAFLPQERKATQHRTPQRRERALVRQPVEQARERPPAGMAESHAIAYLQAVQTRSTL
jgi:hypothetical protein